jgi:endonuclease/exonuclease/phosphatase family metal-dependent hydrolase
LQLLDRENVAVVCKFGLKSDPSVKFLVATTHLLYNPKRQDIRLAQIQILLAELDRISKVKVDERDRKVHLPIILSGDFNLQPYSAPYNLIMNGEKAKPFLDISQATVCRHGQLREALSAHADGGEEDKRPIEW